MDAPLPHDGRTVGEVVMRTPWLTASYVKDPERSAELWRSGWLHSGDVGFIGPDGYLQITDRIKDVIKSGGEWISSLDLENLISQHPAVLEAAVVGHEDADGLTKPRAFVVRAPGADVEVAALQAFVKARLAPFKYPRWIEFVDELPKTATGKIQRFKLRGR